MWDYFSNLPARWLASETWVTLEFPCSNKKWRPWGTRGRICLVQCTTTTTTTTPCYILWLLTNKWCMPSRRVDGFALCFETLPWRWFDPVVCFGFQSPIPCRWPCYADCQSWCWLGSYSLPFRLLGRLCWSCQFNEPIRVNPVSEAMFRQNRREREKKSSSVGKCFLCFSLVLLGYVTACWPNSVAVIHHSGWLVVDYFTVVVAFPRPFVFFELRRPRKRTIIDISFDISFHRPIN